MTLRDKCQKTSTSKCVDIFRNLDKYMNMINDQHQIKNGFIDTEHMMIFVWFWLWVAGITVAVNAATIVESVC